MILRRPGIEPKYPKDQIYDKCNKTQSPKSYKIEKTFWPLTLAAYSFTALLPRGEHSTSSKSLKLHFLCKAKEKYIRAFWKLVTIAQNNLNLFHEMQTSRFDIQGTVISKIEIVEYTANL